jgi:AGZA family xanthine/uracil permease-like MFS transporter
MQPLQALRYVYAPALVVVGLLMTASARHLQFDDLTELVPAFATITMMVFTYNIANGLTAGLLLHPVVKVAAGRVGEVRPGAWVLAGMSLLYYVLGLPH